MLCKPARRLFSGPELAEHLKAEYERWESAIAIPKG